MKKTIITITFIFNCFFLSARPFFKDVLYLKNGSIIRGIFIEQIPNNLVKIEAEVRNFQEYKNNEIEKITKEYSNYERNKTKKQIQTNIIIRGGLNIAYIKSPDEKDYWDIKTLTGFNFGAFTDFNLSKSFSLSAGASYSMRGYRANFNQYSFEPMTTMDQPTARLIAKSQYRSIKHYIDIPLMLKFNFNRPGVKLFCFSGPYIGIGISGANRSFTKMEDTSFTDTYKYSFEGNNRFDIGQIIGLGAQFGSYEISGSYWHRFFGGYFDKKRLITLTIGYRFGRKD